MKTTMQDTAAVRNWFDGRRSIRSLESEQNWTRLSGSGLSPKLHAKSPRLSSLPKRVRFRRLRSFIPMYSPSCDTARPGRLLRYVDALREGVASEMERDPRVFLFGLDVDDHKAIQGSTRGLQQQFGRDRVFNTPLSEDAMTGVAIGAAMAGFRPIHVHIRMDFLMLCMNQLVNMAAKAHYMYGGTVSVPMVVRSMIGKSWGQGAQHSQGLYSLFMHVPGLKVVAPSNAYDAKGCMIAAIRDHNPVIFVEHRLLYPTEAPVPAEPYCIEFGHARVMRHGEDLTIVGISNMAVE